MTDIRKQFDQSFSLMVKDRRPPKKKPGGEPATEENSSASKPHGRPPEVAPWVSRGSAPCTPEASDQIQAKKNPGPNRERTRRFGTRVTPEEEPIALRNIASSGMGQEAFLRHLLLYGASKLPLAENAATRKALYACLLTLNRAAGSVDHIAQNVNAGSLVEHACFEAMLDIRVAARGMSERLESTPVRRKCGPRPRPSRSEAALLPAHNRKTNKPS